MKNNATNKELIAAGHQLAKALGSASPLMDTAKLVSDLATRLDCAVVRGDVLQAERDALAVQLAELAKQEPSRQALRNLVDVVWNCATESTEVPATAEADKLIDTVFTHAEPPAPVVLPEPYCVVCDYVYDAQELRDALDLAGVKWVRKGEADE